MAYKEGSGAGGGAPTTATYIVETANASLTQERVATDTATIAWDFGTAGQAKLDVVAPYVLGTRSIGTTAPLSGGGNLTADRTLSVAAFAAGSSGIVPASGGGTVNFLRADGSWAVPSGVPSTRAINTTAPLGGGGDLSADRTLTVSTFSDVASGIVPASGGGAVNFLRADGSWAAPASGGSGATAYVDLTGAANTRKTATVVDANVSGASQITVTWGAVLDTDDNDPEMDDITFSAIPTAGQFTLVASCPQRIEGRVRINYRVN